MTEAFKEALKLNRPFLTPKINLVLGAKKEYLAALSKTEEAGYFPWEGIEEF